MQSSNIEWCIRDASRRWEEEKSRAFFGSSGANIHVNGDMSVVTSVKGDLQDLWMTDN